MHYIPYGRQNITDDDIASVIQVLKSDYLTQGPLVPKFEHCVAEYVNAKHAIAVNSATSALHIACLALGLQEGDWLWTSPNTFVASANCARYCNANVDFVDIDPTTYNMDVEALKQKLELAERDGKLPKVVVPVAFAGQSCDMQAIHALATQYGFYVIEDASHAIGGEYLGAKVGNCHYADITVFSFHPVKIVTTAEGGMAVTNNSSLADKMRLYRSHGITRDKTSMTTESEGDWYYQQIDLGLNYRMTEIQAALGLSQMQRIDAYVEQRHCIAERYNALLNIDAIILPFQALNTKSAFHLYPIVLRETRQRRAVFDSLRSANIGVNVHYIPVHTQPYYQRLGFKVGDYPRAEAYYAGALSLPMFPTLTEQEQHFVVDTLKACLK